MGAGSGVDYCKINKDSSAPKDVRIMDLMMRKECNDLPGIRCVNLFLSLSLSLCLCDRLWILNGISDR